MPRPSLDASPPPLDAPHRGRLDSADLTRTRQEDQYRARLGRQHLPHRLRHVSFDPRSRRCGAILCCHRKGAALAPNDRRMVEQSRQRALVEFVEKPRAHSLERWIGLQTAGENSFGHDLNPGTGADAAVEPDPLAHGRANSFAQQEGHPGGK